MSWPAVRAAHLRTSVSRWKSRHASSAWRSPRMSPGSVCSTCGAVHASVIIRHGSGSRLSPPGQGPAVSRESRPSGGRQPPVSWTRSGAACALRMSRREMLGERQVAAPLMAQRAAHGALSLAHRRFQPGQGAGIQLAGLRLSGKSRRPSPCQFGHQKLVLAFALFAPAAARPGQHGAVRWQRGRQVGPSGHASTVGQRFVRLVLDDRRSGAEHPVRHWLGGPLFVR